MDSENYINIVVPKGYTIDKENSTFEKIVFKKKYDRPRTWEEFCKRGFTGKEGCFNAEGAFGTVYIKGETRHTTNVAYVDNIEEAKAFVALMQLRQLRKAWVGDWEPDWTKTDIKYIIEPYNGLLRISRVRHISRSLSFPTEEIANEFIKCFKDLLEQAKILL